MVAVRWNSRLRSGDLACLITDRFVNPGSTVVDIGASWGFFSYHLAERVGHEGRVFSFEPHPANAQGLRKLAIAQPQVRFKAAAISDASGNAPMFVPRMRFRAVTAQSSLAHGFQGVEGIETDILHVPTVRLDDEISPDSQVDFMKIDVEGHELTALRGAAGTLRRSHPVLLIEIEQRHLGGPIGTVFDELSEAGYHVFCIAGNALLPLDSFDAERDQLARVVPGQFTPFDMPEGYINEFVAVHDPTKLQGLPVRN